jgi:hypothetical protein
VGGGTAITPALPANFARLPVYFEANQGQTDAQAQFIARGSNYTSFLTASGPVLELPRGGPANADGTRTLDVVSFQYQGANTNAVVNGLNQLTSFSNYFVGGSSTIDVPQFGSVRYQNFYPNIDLVYHADSESFSVSFLGKQQPDTVLVAEYKPSNKPGYGGTNFLVESGWYDEKWRLTVYPVPRAVRHLANLLIRELGLPLLVQWLRSSGRAGWLTRNQRIELQFNPAEETLSAEENSGV